MSPTPRIVVRRSFAAGRVGVSVKIRCSRGFGVNNDTATIAASLDLTTDDARKVAADLIAAADREDAKQAADHARDARRKAWREREVAAGRIKLLGRQS